MILSICSKIRRRFREKKSNRPRTVAYIGEKKDWVIKRIGEYITRGVHLDGTVCRARHSARGCHRAVVHFGSMHGLVNLQCVLDSSNKIIVTVFHGNRGTPYGFDASLDSVLAQKDTLARIVVSNTLMRDRFIAWGVPVTKLVLIPLGVDLRYFKPCTAEQRRQIRGKLSIPNDSICVGSFQKDGSGWKEGFEPKMIKGPDVFVEVVKRLSRQRKIHCVLLGPARGYVKKRLEAEGIPYTHRFLKNYEDIVAYYQCLDMYIVTAREEGGPLSLMESMATGVPLVSTQVGMAPDIIQNGKNAFLCAIDDVSGLVDATATILQNPTLRENMVMQALETVKAYDWNLIVKHYESLYKDVIAK